MNSAGIYNLTSSGTISKNPCHTLIAFLPAKQVNRSGPGANLPVTSSDIQHTAQPYSHGSAATALATRFHASSKSHHIHPVLPLSCDAPMEAAPLAAVHEDGVSVSLSSITFVI